MLMALDNGRLHYDIVGTDGGEVICLVHSLAADGGMWAEQVPALLEAGYRVLRVDMRGHGGSDPVTGNYTMAQLAGDLAALFDRLSIDAVHYVGLSLGGMCGQALALDYGSRVRSLAICDALPASLPDADLIWGPRISAVRKAGSLAPVAEATLQRWLTADYRRRNPERWRQILDTVAATSPEGYIGCAAAIMDFDHTSRLPGLSMPVIVVTGADDPGVPPSEGERIARLVPGARFEAIADAMHLPNVEQPAAFNRMLLGWLEAQASG